MTVHLSQMDARLGPTSVPLSADAKVADQPKKDAAPLQSSATVTRHGLLVAIVMVCVILSGCAQIQGEVPQDNTVNKLRNLTASSEEPLRALYIGELSKAPEVHQRLLQGVSERLNVSFTVVGKDPRDAKALLSEPTFALGYDAVVYNTCFSDPASLSMAENAIAQTRDYGVGALVLPCGVRSFEDTSPFGAESRRHQQRLAEWNEINPTKPFPYWWSFTGVAVGGSAFQGRSVALGQ